MNEIVKAFQIGFILRSFFSGAFFAIAFHVTCRETNQYEILQITSENILKLDVPLAIIMGVTVYGLHRSLLYPPFEWLINVQRFRRLGNWLISHKTIERIVERWDKRAPTDCDKSHNRAKQLESWADFIHLQFSSAWCIIFGSLTAVAVNGDWSDLTFCPQKWRITSDPLQCFVFLLMVAAIISNMRTCAVEDYIDKLKPKDAQKVPYQ